MALQGIIAAKKLTNVSVPSILWAKPDLFLYMNQDAYTGMPLLLHPLQATTHNAIAAQENATIAQNVGA